MPSGDLSTAIRAALLIADPRAKVMATRALVRRWRRGELVHGFSVAMPDRPFWPDYLELRPPGQMPKRGKGGSQRNRAALWHSLAHIEFVAIDLALDMAGRFGGQMGQAFVADFLGVAADEALHFALVARKLRTLGLRYGDLPAHDGLWSSAQATAHDVAARLAVVPMVLEARGLDVTPAMIERVRTQGDEPGARILERILDDEIRHVAVGARHFAEWCESREMAADSTWLALVRQHFVGAVKPPFNDSARLAAGLSRQAYEALA
jgi:uncharacterized ferritin-like protein (DUF455 family)